MASTKYELRTFLDLVTAVIEEVGIQSTDTVALNRIKRDINAVYVNEVVPAEQWKWLRDYVQLTHLPYLNSGSASVTQNTNTVTLTIAPASSQKNSWFSVDGQSEVYRIAQHTAGSTTLTLETAYVAATSATAGYKIWTDKLALPPGCRDTLLITHDYSDQPVEARGLREFRRIVTALPKAEGYPQFYTTNDYIDPTPYLAVSGLPAPVSRSSNGLVKTIVFASDVSSYLTVGDNIEISSSGNTFYNCRSRISSIATTTITYTSENASNESSAADTGIILKKLENEKDDPRSKELWVYPSICQFSTVMHVDFIRDAQPLIEDSDEPLMPMEDRIVLLYGALARAWSRYRNDTEAARNNALYNSKLAKMQGKLDDSTDYPQLRTNRVYLSGKRSARRMRDQRSFPDGWGGGSSSQATPVATGNRAAQFNTNTGMLEASAVLNTELARLSGIGSQAVGISDTNTLTHKSIDATANTLSNIANAAIASSAAIAYSKLNLTGSITNSDINSSAAIALSKFAALTTRSVVMSDSNGVLTTMNGGIFNVQAYGATGDGSTDDTTAIQAAVDAASNYYGGTVYFPGVRNHYKITSTITVAGNTPIRIIGDGPTASQIRFSGASAVPMFILSSLSTNGCEMANLLLNNEGSATIAIQVNCTKVFLHNLFTYSTVKFSTAFISTYQAAAYCYYTIIRDCYGASTVAGQETPIFVLAGGGHTVIVDGCMFAGFSTAGVKFQLDGLGGHVLGASVTNSHFESFAGDSSNYPGSHTAVGIYADGIIGLNVSGTNFQMNGNAESSANGQRGIALYEVIGANLQGNLHFNTGAGVGVSIRSSSAKNINIEGNTFYHMDYGIEVTASGSSYFVGTNNGTLITTALVNDTYAPLATTGVLRAPSATNAVSWRNAANSADLGLSTNSSDQLTFPGGFSFRKDQNAVTRAFLENANSGASASAKLTVTSDVDDFDITNLSSGGGNGVTLTSQSGITNGIQITATSGPLKLRTANDCITVDHSRNVVLGTAALATNVTDGFLYIPTCAGTPTGVPTSYTGRAPMIYDTTNHKFWIYDGAWKGVVLS